MSLTVVPQKHDVKTAWATPWPGWAKLSCEMRNQLFYPHKRMNKIILTGFALLTFAAVGYAQNTASYSGIGSVGNTANVNANNVGGGVKITQTLVTP